MSITYLAEPENRMAIDPKIHRFPLCIVWTPIPLITWFLPFIGHMGITTSTGIIRDFAGSYFVSENSMAFGWPTLYWLLSLDSISGGASAYDKAIEIASNEYNSHTHNILCDNCHSHVAMALNSMRYAGKTNWNMVNLAFYMLIRGKFVGFQGFLRQYLPFALCVSIIIVIFCVSSC